MKDNNSNRTEIIDELKSRSSLLLIELVILAIIYPLYVWIFRDTASVLLAVIGIVPMLVLIALAIVIIVTIVSIVRSCLKFVGI